MPTGKAWTMNCVLLGATVKTLLDEGKEDTAREHLKELTPEFDPKDVEYLIFRLNLLRLTEVIARKEVV